MSKRSIHPKKSFDPVKIRPFKLCIKVCLHKHRYKCKTKCSYEEKDLIVLEAIWVNCKKSVSCMSHSQDSQNQITWLDVSQHNQ